MPGAGDKRGVARLRLDDELEELAEEIAPHTPNFASGSGYESEEQALARSIELKCGDGGVWSPQQRTLVHLTEPLPEDFKGDVDACCANQR